MSSAEIDTLVVGAGVVGLAVARALTRTGRSVLVVEREDRFGAGISSRSSEVIHAGIYYPPGSLKARLCVAGKALLYAFCAAHDVAHRNCGKLIVATDRAQVAKLEEIQRGARACGVDDLVLLARDEVRALEPDLRVVAALHSPSTGIVDSHGLMLALLGAAEARGAEVAYNTRVTRVVVDDGFGLCVDGGDEPVVSARELVNAAGLGAQALAATIDGLGPAHRPGLWLAKGTYFTYGAKTRFRHLIYPVPEPGGLGTHLTLDLAGQPRFGPDVEWVESIDYAVDESRRDRFAAAVARYWPGVDAALLSPGYAGIRPKIAPPGAPAADFVVSGPRDHGLPGLVNLFGIESPGITSSLALADLVVDTLGGAA